MQLNGKMNDVDDDDDNNINNSNNKNHDKCNNNNCIEKSKKKVYETAKDIQECLLLANIVIPSISSQQLSEQQQQIEMENSNNNIHNNTTNIVRYYPCKKYNDTINYRCKCTFQILHTISKNSNESTDDDDVTFQLATRENGHPIPIILSSHNNEKNNNNLHNNETTATTINNSDYTNDNNNILCFLRNSIRIQNVLSKFIHLLNEKEYCTTIITNNITSITVSSSWNGIFAIPITITTTLPLPTETSSPLAISSSTSTSTCVDSSDCVMTLHYNESIQNEALWKQQVQQLCIHLQINQITGRSYKQCIVVQNPLLLIAPSSSSATCSKPVVTTVSDNNNTAAERVVNTTLGYNNFISNCIPSYPLRDTIYLQYNRSTFDFDSRNNSGLRDWTVSLLPYSNINNNNCTISNSNQHESDNNDSTDQNNSIQVQYVKSESSFFHPNPKIMCTALSWILSTIHGIIQTSAKNNCSNNSKNNNTVKQYKYKLIELYSGCGAHSIAIAKANILGTDHTYNNNDDVMKYNTSTCTRFDTRTPAPPSTTTTTICTSPITSIEYDQRLVNGFEYNCLMNSISYCTTSRTFTKNNSNSNGTANKMKSSTLLSSCKTKDTTTNDIDKQKEIEVETATATELDLPLVSDVQVTTTTSTTTINTTIPNIEIVHADAGRWCCSYILKCKNIATCTRVIENKTNKNITATANGTASEMSSTISSSSLLQSSLSLSLNLRNTKVNTFTNTIVLVDPPRSGLSNDVIEFLLYNPLLTTIQHVLYISCGTDALKHDIRRLLVVEEEKVEIQEESLSSSKTSTTTNTTRDNNNKKYPFTVVDCIVLDLFPGTLSVETVIHLKRK